MEPKTKLLYVDDEAINLRLFELVLNDDFEIFTATDGNKGLDILNNHTDIQVVISDMKMPYMTGLEFINQARLKHTTPQYYILTGYDITDEIKEAINSGLINNYFSKPFNLNELAKILKQ
jgi:two-component system, response regulator, stage 0 sporulation protein F